MISSVRSSRNKESQFVIKSKLGEGNFGEVEKCEHKETSKIYAVKSIMVNIMFLDEIEKEADNMLKTNSEYVIELIDHFYDQKNNAYVLVTPYYKQGSLKQLMSKDWEYEELMLFFYQIARGLYDLHKQELLHLDLKPENILLRAPGQYVICDMGCSRNLSKQNNINNQASMRLNVSSIGVRGKGTTEYASPDLTLNEEMTPYSDVWSLGVILYKIIFKNHPLTKLPNMYGQKLQEFDNGSLQIKYLEGPNTEQFKSVIPVIKRMLVSSKDKKNRIGWKEILEKIFEIMKIPEQRTNYIVTNFDLFLAFVDHTSILLSALLHYSQQLTDYLQAYKIDMRPAIKQSCIYLLTISKEIVSQTKQIHQDFWHFYLFDATRRSLTQKQKSYAEYLEKQAIGVANEQKVKIEYQTVKISRERIIYQYGKIYKKIRSLAEPEKIVQKIELKKLLQILDYVGFYSFLNYEKRKDLANLVKELIYS